MVEQANLAGQVPAGGECVCKVTFKAPAVAGIYVGYFRLTYQGSQFGPKVWCSISVQNRVQEPAREEQKG